MNTISNLSKEKKIDRNEEISKAQKLLIKTSKSPRYNFKAIFRLMFVLLKRVSRLEEKVFNKSGCGCNGKSKDEPSRVAKIVTNAIRTCGTHFPSAVIDHNVKTLSLLPDSKVPDSLLIGKTLALSLYRPSSSLTFNHSIVDYVRKDVRLNIPFYFEKKFGETPSSTGRSSDLKDREVFLILPDFIKVKSSIEKEGGVYDGPKIIRKITYTANFPLTLDVSVAQSRWIMVPVDFFLDDLAQDTDVLMSWMTLVYCLDTQDVVETFNLVAHMNKNAVALSSRPEFNPDLTKADSERTTKAIEQNIVYLQSAIDMTTQVIGELGPENEKTAEMVQLLSGASALMARLQDPSEPEWFRMCSLTAIGDFSSQVEAIADSL